MKIPLVKFMEDKCLTQNDAAKILDVTQGAISKAVIADREVYVVVDKTGHVVDAEEVVKFGRGRRDRHIGTESNNSKDCKVD